MKYIYTIFILFCFYPVFSQVHTNFHNPKIITDKGYFQTDHKNRYLQLASPDSSQILAHETEDNGKKSGKPLRVAEKINVDIDVTKEADWITEGQFMYGKVTLVAGKAKSLSIFCNAFHMPENAEMYIYNPRGEMISGPITSTENNPNNTWGSVPLGGDSLIIELKVPSQSMGGT